MLVYKPNARGEKLTEDSPLMPTWDYPKSKVETEELIGRVRGNIPAVILRIAGVYDEVCQSIPLAHQIQRIYEHRLEGHLYSGNLDVRQSYVHLNDVVRAFEACVANANKLSGYDVFNIGEPQAMTYDETQRAVARTLFDRPWATFEVPKPIARAGAWVEEVIPIQHDAFVKPWMIDHADENFDLNIDKARVVLGWEPRHSLQDTLPTILEGLIVDPEKWYRLNKLHFPHDAHHEWADKQIEARQSQPIDAPKGATKPDAVKPTLFLEPPVNPPIISPPSNVTRSS